MENSKEIYVVLDETSALHLKDNDYFIIGGYIVEDIDNLKYKCKSIEKKLRKNHPYISKMKEIKGTTLKYEHLIEYVDFVNQNSVFSPISIIIKKKQLTNFLITNQNSAYNFFVTQLMKFLIKNNIIDGNKYNKINLYLDNRTVATIFKKDLETHLNLTFHKTNIIFQTQLFNSKHHIHIRLADLICYLSHNIYNNKNNDKKKIALIKTDLAKINFDIDKYKAFFPF